MADTRLKLDNNEIVVLSDGQRTSLTVESVE
jgi:hypothetical protein